MGSHLTVPLLTVTYVRWGNAISCFTPRKPTHAANIAPFQLVYGDLMGPFKPTSHGGFKFVSNITHQFIKWTAVYLICSKYQALASLQLFVTSTVIPLGKRIIK